MPYCKLLRNPSAKRRWCHPVVPVMMAVLNTRYKVSAGVIPSIKHFLPRALISRQPADLLRSWQNLSQSAGRVLDIASIEVFEGAAELTRFHLHFR